MSDKAKNSILKKVYHFYRHDCCWPYAASFYLVLIIYWLDFFVVNGPRHWQSYLAYVIIFAYYLYNLRLYKQGRICSKEPRFFIRFLTLKITFWGLILLFFTFWHHKL